MPEGGSRLSRGWPRVALLVVAVVLGGMAGPAAAAPGARAKEPANEPLPGAIVPVAGNGETGFSGDGHRATDARLGDRLSLEAGPDGAIYIADRDSRRVRRVGANGVITTVPGSLATRSRSTRGSEVVDGWRYSPFDPPESVAVTPDGTLFSAGEDTIRRIGPGGEVEQVFARFTADEDLLDGDIEDIAVGGDRVYLASERGELFRLRDNGQVELLGGDGSLRGERADGRPVANADFAPGFELAAGEDGNVYLVQDAVVLRVDRDGIVHLVAGGQRPGYAGDGGPASPARLSEDLVDLTVGRDGNVYVIDKGNGVIRMIDGSGTISTVGPAGDTSRAFTSLAVDGSGTIYAAAGSRVVRVVGGYAAPGRPVAATAGSPVAGERPGTVRTVVGTGTPPPEAPDDSPAVAGRSEPWHGAVGPDGSYYLAYPAEHVVRRISKAGEVTVVAGTGEDGFSGDGGRATQARLDRPVSVAVDGDGVVYIADRGNNRVRRIGDDGRISTHAGNGEQGEPGGMFGEEVAVGGRGGPATEAAVTPSDLEVARDGSLYVAEAANKRISRIDPSGRITTIAGGGERYKDEAEGHPATEASLFAPTAVAVSPAGEVYYVERYGEAASTPVVWMIDADGVLRTAAGDSFLDPEDGDYGGDGGPATEARLNTPRDVAVDADGTVFIADTYNARIRAVARDGTIRTVAGTGERADTGDGGRPAVAAVKEPETVDVGPDGAVYLLSQDGGRLRVIADGTIRTLAELELEVGSAAFERTPAPRLAVSQVSRMAVDRAGTLYFRAQANLRTVDFAVDPSGMVDELEFDGLGPRLFASAPDGALYVAGRRVVWRVLPDGRAAIVAGNRVAAAEAADAGARPIRDGRRATTVDFNLIHHLDVTVDGELLIANDAGIYRVRRDGTIASVTGTGAARGRISDLAAGPDGSVYVASAKENRVYRFDASGNRSVVAGNGEDVVFDDEIGDGGDATEAILRNPTSIEVDPDGVVFVSGFEGIRRVKDGEIDTVYENLPDAEGSRRSMGPMELDANGDLYFGDGGRHRIAVLAAPAEYVEPIWATLLWLIGGATVLAGGVWGYFFRRLFRTPQS